MNIENYLNKLEEIPITAEEKEQYGNYLGSINKTKGKDFVINSALIAEEISEYIFEQRNIPDDYFEAYSDSFSNSIKSLYENYSQILETDNPKSIMGFISKKSSLMTLRVMVLMVRGQELLLAKCKKSYCSHFVESDIC